MLSRWPRGSLNELMRTGKRKALRASGPQDRSQAQSVCQGERKEARLLPNMGTNWATDGWVEMGWWCQDM